jgi:hypothetical protein
MTHCIRVALCWSLAIIATSSNVARAGTGAPEVGAKPSGVTIRWKVEHRAEVRTTVNGTTQTAETLSNSVKVWQITSVDLAKKQARFVHSVESVDMRQVLSGRQEVRYNSQTDATPPPGFEDVAKDVGVPLSEFTIDLRGYVLGRQEKRKDSRPSQGEITVPLADQEVAVGEVWSQPNVVTVKYKDGSPKQIKTRQDYKLLEVDKGIATIQLETTIITPINDPAIDAQLIQQVVDGVIRFDIDAGRVVSQQTDVDKHVIGFQGDTSSLHYVTRFKERLTNEESSTSAKAPTGPPPPGASPKTAAKEPGKLPTGAQSAVRPSTLNKSPAAQTARGPATKRAASPQPKKPSTGASPPAKNSTPSKTARRTQPAASPPPASQAPPKPSTAPAGESPADDTDPDA